MTRRALNLALAVILVLIGVAAWLLLRSLDGLVKDAIQGSASTAMQVPVAVESVRIGISAGSATINGLTIANPPGFTGPYAFSLDQIQVTLDRSTVFSNPIVVQEVAIVAPKVFFEVDRTGEANIDVIRRNIESQRAATDTVASPGGPAEAPPAGAPADTPGAMTPVLPPRVASADARRFVIKTLSIRGAELDIDAQALGGKHKRVELDETQVHDLGHRTGGATGPEIAELVVLTLARDVATTVAAEKIEAAITRKIGGQAGKALGESLGQAVKELGGALNKILNE